VRRRGCRWGEFGAVMPICTLMGEPERLADGTTPIRQEYPLRATENVVYTAYALSRGVGATRHRADGSNQVFPPSEINGCLMRRFRKCLSSCMVAGLVVAGTAAAAEPPRFEVSGFGAYRFGGEFENEATGRSVDLDDGGGWGLGLALYRDPVSFYEFLYSTQRASLDQSDPLVGGLDVTTEYFQVGGTLLFPQ